MKYGMKTITSLVSGLILCGGFTVLSIIYITINKDIASLLAALCSLVVFLGFYIVGLLEHIIDMRSLK